MKNESEPTQRRAQKKNGPLFQTQKYVKHHYCVCVCFMYVCNIYIYIYIYTHTHTEDLGGWRGELLGQQHQPGHLWWCNG